MNILANTSHSQWNSNYSDVGEVRRQSVINPVISVPPRERQMVWVTAATEIRASEPFLLAPHSSVRHLKSLIQFSFHIPISEQVLKLDQRIIEDYRTLSEEGILDQARLTVAAKKEVWVGSQRQSSSDAVTARGL